MKTVFKLFVPVSLVLTLFFIIAPARVDFSVGHENLSAVTIQHAGMTLGDTMVEEGEIWKKEIVPSIEEFVKVGLITENAKKNKNHFIVFFEAPQSYHFKPDSSMYKEITRLFENKLNLLVPNIALTLFAASDYGYVYKEDSLKHVVGLLFPVIKCENTEWTASNFPFNKKSATDSIIIRDNYYLKKFIKTIPKFIKSYYDYADFAIITTLKDKETALLPPPINDQIKASILSHIFTDSLAMKIIYPGLTKIIKHHTTCTDCPESVEDIADAEISCEKLMPYLEYYHHLDRFEVGMNYTFVFTDRPLMAGTDRFSGFDIRPAFAAKLLLDPRLDISTLIYIDQIAKEFFSSALYNNSKKKWTETEKLSNLRLYIQDNLLTSDFFKDRVKNLIRNFKTGS